MTHLVMNIRVDEDFSTREALWRLNENLHVSFSIFFQELICGWIVERKTFPDLSSSICDGRYEEHQMGFCEV